MSVINTNILALTSQNNLQKSQTALGSAIERLSSGMRINSAKDDAAGQAIANRFTSNVRGLTQATRNANDGISIAQTTEGALDEINNNIQRIRELTVQAANGSNSGKDLESIQNEIQERLDEIDRVSRQTDFNGVKVLGGESGSVQKMVVQVGAHDNEIIEINLKAINSNTLGLGNFTVAGPKGTPDAGKVNDALQAKYGETTQLSSDSIRIGGLPASGADASDPSFKNTLATAINTIAGFSSSDTNKFAADNVSVVADENNNLFVEFKFGGDDAVGAAQREALAKAGVQVGDDDTAVYLALPEGVVNDDGDEVNFIVDDITAADLSSVGTKNPLAALDAARDQVDALRSHLGAVQNRFESTITNLNNTVNNLSAARSRIEDADYAVEVSNMTRAQILQQAGTSVLAQANQVPQTVLSLLR